MTSVTINSRVLAQAILYSIVEYGELIDAVLRGGEISRLKALLPFTQVSSSMNVSVKDMALLMRFKGSKEILKRGVS